MEITVTKRGHGGVGVLTLSKESVGLVTSAGRVDKVNPKTVIIDGERFNDLKLQGVTVAFTEAKKFGFIQGGGVPVYSAQSQSRDEENPFEDENEDGDIWDDTDEEYDDEEY